ncbi:hypothetical protein ACFVH4_18980 [Nocardia ignorata]|uniref:hypothetical protein n=1 Tax=Nocardia ignorata TaxID=145285 RepID=UPI003641A58D
MSNSQLDAFRREVNINLAVGALADVELPVTSNDGGFPVVVALEDEPLSKALGRIRAAGGYANLFVSNEDRRVRMVAFMDSGCAVNDQDADDMTGPGEAPGIDATVGMFVDWLEQCPNGVKLSAEAVGQRDAYARDAQDIELSPA